MDQTKINFIQVRDFGETFNVSIKFIRQNFKLFFYSIICIAGPFILISALSGAYYESTTAGQFIPSNYPKTLEPHLYLYIISTILSYIILIGAVFSFIITYTEKGPNNFTVNDVAWTFLKNILKLFSTALTITIVVVLIVAVIIGIVTPLFNQTFISLLLIVILILSPPLTWQMSVIFLLRMQENKSSYEAYSRTKVVMRKNYWLTWLIAVCSTLAVGLAGFIISLPQIAYQVALMFHVTDPSVLYIIVSALCTFLTTIVYSVLYVINGVHYYSLAEKNDGQGLMERINEIGNTSKSNVEQHY